jgi:hypothetical protein
MLMATLRAVSLVLACSSFATAAYGQHELDESNPRRLYVGSSLFILGNLVPDDHPPVFFQLNAGYRVTPSDTVSVEAITWRYYHPLGIPWWSSRDSADEEYPGHVREYGVGPNYQRFWWKGIYSSLTVIPFLRQYYDSNDRKIGSGFELFFTLRLGYHLCFWKRVFVEPSIAFNFWPVTTNVPAAFAAQDEKWPSFFLFEPGAHFGVEF